VDFSKKALQKYNVKDGLSNPALDYALFPASCRMPDASRNAVVIPPTLLNVVAGMPDFRCQTPDARRQMADARCQTPDARRQMSDARLQK